MRHNNTPKSLHPTRWLLALSFLLMLPGIAAAQSVSGYGEASGSLDGAASCQELKAQQDLPEASGEAHYQTSGNINDDAGWGSQGDAYVNQPDLPDAYGRADESVEAGPVSQHLNGRVDLDDDEARVSASSCSEADASELKETAKDKIAEARARAEALIEGAKETAGEAKASVSAHAYATIKATTQFAAEVKASVSATASASLDAAAQFAAEALAMVEATAASTLETLSSVFVEIYASAHASVQAQA